MEIVLNTLKETYPKEIDNYDEVMDFIEKELEELKKQND